jgi:hypothetical protein
MSELAFDANGEPFDLPATAAYWRVRRFRNIGARGGPEVVFGRDGSPLILPIDTDLAEFRAQTEGVPGRYRLDPLDERQRPVGGLPAAYLQISEPPRGPASAGEEHSAVIRELARANADMAKTIADKFAAVMQSAADLLRAADGAGLPARTPPAGEPRNGATADDDDGDEEEPRSELAEIIKQVMPLVQLAVTRMLSGRGAGPRNGGAAGEPAPAAPPEAGAANAGAAPQASGEKDVAAQLGAIEAALAPEEVNLVRRAMTAMAPDVLQAWAAKLCGLSVEDAVQAVRAEIAKGGAA